jgi:hypothetical protein
MLKAEPLLTWPQEEISIDQLAQEQPLSLCIAAPARKFINIMVSYCPM